MSWTLIADGVVAILLVATLIYVRRLSKRLEAIHAGRAEFEKLIGDLTKSTDQAAGHLQVFKTTAQTVSSDLQARVDRAQSLAAEFGRIGEDLKHLAERAESAANRLEAAIGKARQSTFMGPAANTPAPAAVHPSPSVDFTDEEENRKVSSLSALSGMR